MAHHSAQLPGHIPGHMKGVLLTGHGDFDCLDYRSDIPVPVPGPGDVLVRVEAAGVNNTDINTRLAWYSKSADADVDAGWSGEAFRFPRIQGADACGRIVAVGSGVSPDRIGERVLIEPCLFEVDGGELDMPFYFGSESDGAFADYTKVAARHAHRIDSTLTSVELASFPCSYSTAENLLTRANLQAGERVFVTGASGGVGSAAVQLAKARGAAVIAQTSRSKFEALRSIGADQVVERSDDLVATLGQRSVDVVVDLVAGSGFPHLLHILKQKGRYAVSGAIGGAFVELDVRTLYLKDLSFFGCTVLEPEVFPNLVALIEQGKITPLVAKTFKLGEIVSAQKAFSHKDFIGKIVLSVAED